MEWLHGLETGFEVFVACAVLALEAIGVLVLLVGGLRAAYAYAIRREKGMRLAFATSMAVGLQFLLCGEIISTLIADDWTHVLTIALVMAIRAAVGFLLHWESGHLRHETAHQGEKTA